jgi:hypothetical protein
MPFGTPTKVVNPYQNVNFTHNTANIKVDAAKAIYEYRQQTVSWIRPNEVN